MKRQDHRPKLVARLRLHFGTPRDQEARRRLADALPPGSEVAEPDEVGVCEVHVEADDYEQALSWGAQSGPWSSAPSPARVASSSSAASTATSLPGKRQNADGVDLNRNSPWHWRPLDVRGGTFWSGPRAASEPETRAILRLVRRLRPAVTVWFHQHARLVDDSGGGRGIERRYARRVGLPFRRYGTFPGSITSWQDATFHRDTAFVVELPAGRMTAAAVRRQMRAVVALTH